MIEVRPGSPVLLPGIDSPLEPATPTSPQQSSRHQERAAEKVAQSTEMVVTDAMAARISAYRRSHPHETGGATDSDILWMIHQEDVDDDIQDRNPYSR